MNSTSRFHFWLVQAVTTVRIPLAVVIAFILFSAPIKPGDEGRIWLCVGLLAIMEITDFLDGWLARRLKVVTEWGAMLDPYADSVARLIVYWTLAEAGMALAAVPLVMAIRDVTAAYCRIVWTQHGKSVSARWSGKIKAVVQGAGAFLILLGPILLGGEPLGTLGTWSQIASWSVMIVTAISGLDYVRPTLGMMGAQSRNT